MDNLPNAYVTIVSNYSAVTNFAGSTSSSEFQQLVSSSCDICTQAIELVNKLGVFSTNETLDDLTTVEIRYLTLPAILGFFKSQLNSDRLSNLKLAISLYEDFLGLCKTYSIHSLYGTTESNRSTSHKGDSTEQLTSQREEKIRRYKAKKNLEEQLDKLSAYVDQPHVDDEVKRDYHLKLVQKWMCIAQEELQTLKMETDLISRGPALSEEKDAPTKPDKPFRPFILTRNAAQAAVFGAGYPSLPTMTIDQFLDEQVKLGIMPPPAQTNLSNGSPRVRRIDPSEDIRKAEDQKKAEQDALEDADDTDAIQKARRFDEFKDEHRRGSGNRMNQA